MTDKSDEVGALWTKKDRNGKKYLSGRITIGGETVDVVVFQNSFKKEGERTPDLRIYRSQPREQSGGSETPSQNFDDMDDAIPFLTPWGLL